MPSKKSVKVIFFTPEMKKKEKRWRIFVFAQQHVSYVEVVEGDRRNIFIFYITQTITHTIYKN